jgi:2-keto-3-deoxy-L-rhamnonate aldolase RhmA
MSQTANIVPLLEKDNKMGSQETTKDQGMLAYAAPSLFQPHNARQAIRDAYERKIPPILCVYYGISSIPVARLLAPIGFDAVWVDWEHTACNVETMTTVRYLAVTSSKRT